MPVCNDVFIIFRVKFRCNSIVVSMTHFYLGEDKGEREDNCTGQKRLRVAYAPLVKGNPSSSGECGIQPLEGLLNPTMPPWETVLLQHL